MTYESRVFMSPLRGRLILERQNGISTLSRFCADGTKIPLQEKINKGGVIIRKSLPSIYNQNGGFISKMPKGGNGEFYFLRTSNGKLSGSVLGEISGTLNAHEVDKLGKLNLNGFGAIAKPNKIFGGGANRILKKVLNSKYLKFFL